MPNEYDNPTFFAQYSQMSRSKGGLSAAGEWYMLKNLLPDFAGKDVLDLGCGYGWHCKYAAEQGAQRILGIDASEKMLATARERNADEKITYCKCGIEEYDYPENTWDVVVSNLALHYIEDLDTVFERVARTLKPGGVFVFNIEHPTFTAGIKQDWLYDEQGQIVCWPVDRYYEPGIRHTKFLGCDVVKYHHTLTQILMGLLHCGFTLEAVEETGPSEEMLELPGMRDELRRPMMLLVRARVEKT